MSRPPASVRLVLAAAALLAGTFLPSAAHAQCWEQPDGTYWCDDGSGSGGTGGSTDGPPSIGFQPREAAVPQPTISVTIQMADDNDLVDATFRVYRGSEDVTSQFSYEKRVVEYPAPYTPRVYATATGSTSLSESGPVQLRAEICDNAPEPFCRSDTGTYTMSIPGVEVTPDAGFETVDAGGTRSVAFTVINRGTVTASFRLDPTCRTPEGLTECTLSTSSSVYLGPGASQAVAVSFSAGQAGTTVDVALTATHTGNPGVTDAGWTLVTLRGGAGTQALPPHVTLVPLNAGATVVRSQCVTAAAAAAVAGAAYECGDLRTAHALPAHRTRGRTWTPVLLYNSQHAHPRPTVYADVTVPAGAPVPSSVEMVVATAYGTVHRASFAGNGFVPGTARRIAVQWDAIFFGTGLYPYQVQVISHYAGGPLSSAPQAGELTIVNRAASPFGAGWWLSGLERLYCIDCSTGGSRTLWVGGDGSTRVYEPTVPGAWSKWVAQNPGGAPDTLELLGSEYMRKLPGGGKVYYDNMGRQVRTVNRLLQATRFTYGTDGLAGVYVPGSGAGGPGTGDPAWIMNWDAGAQLVRSISATLQGAPTRTTSLTIDGDRRVTAITDPDTKGVVFGYHPAAYLRMDHRRDRRGSWTYYGYDAAGKLQSARTQMGSAPSEADPTSRFVAAEGRGVASDGATNAASVAVAEAYTHIDGARTDVNDHTWLWLNSTGMPVRVRDPVGAQTRVEYEDARFPGLATRVTSASGVISSAVYDHRGRLTSSTVSGAYGGGETSTSTQAWDPVCDRPTLIKSPGVDSVHAGYDQVTCNVLWQRQGADTARTVRFFYYPAGHAHAGQVDSVQGPIDAQGRRAVERVRYDARGNLERTISPLGFLTLYQNDELGRLRDVYTPVTASTATDEPGVLLNGVRQNYTYNVMDRVRATVTYGPAIDQGHVDLGTTRAEWLRVETEYDDGGLPLSVTRTISNAGLLEPQVTTYQYDRAGRKTHEWTNPVVLHIYEYDPAGNVVKEFTPQLATIINRYDAANRLVRRQVEGAIWPQMSGSCPAVMDPRWGPTEQFNCAGARYPFYPNYGTGYQVPEEWTYFGYDAAGNLRWAENADAVVRRSYFPNGQLRGDTLSIRDGGTHGLRYDYNTATGQLWLLHHPENLAWSGAFDEYQYDPVTGVLAGLLDRNGNRFSFNYDKAGRRTSGTSPGGITDSLVYDLDGRLQSRRLNAAAYGTTPLLDEAYTYDARDKVVQVATQPTLNRNAATTFRQFYSGLGNLVMTDWANVNDPQWQRERFTMDPLGNMVHKRTFKPGVEDGGNDHPDFAYTLHPTQGHVTQVELVDISTHQLPDTAGAPRDKTRFSHDGAGNQVAMWQRVDGPSSSDGGYKVLRAVDSRSYYGHDGKLRALQRYDESYASDPPKGSGIWEEYRYDPLGRRVMVITKRPPDLCNVDAATCISAVTEFIWSGDQLLWERKNAEGTYAQQAGGTVSYTHGGGIDRPLAIWKSGVGSIIPHENWRGQMARGTYGAGHTRVGQSSDCTTYPPQNCEPIPWPGWNTSAWHEETTKPELTGVQHYWDGSLSVGMRDASGQMYMRNRYYNPQSGQFTQPDPIGLAGGMNVYGFAAGDPVTYSDPYGLCPKEANDGAVCLDFFIAAKSEMGFKGDGRSFDPNAAPDESRIQVVVSADGDLLWDHISDSCGRFGCAKPDPYLPAIGNWIESNKHGDGSFTVTVNGINSAVPGGFAPAINASVTFTPDGSGSFNTSGNRDHMPSLGIYQRRNGAWTELPGGRRSEKGGVWLLPFMPNDRW